MAEILDFYVDSTGRKWKPQFFTDSHFLARAEFYNHVYFGVFLITGQGTPIKLFSNHAQAFTWLQAHGETLPQKFVCTETKRRLAKTGGRS